MTAIETAYRKVSAGQPAEGQAMLEAAGRAGDASALAELAVWHLAGSIVPRDLPAARALLKRAVAIGHVDAALMEIALTANGSGGAPDWPAALALLRQAAPGDPLAAEHLALLNAMALGPDGAPTRLPQSEQLHDHPAIRRFPGFCTPAEAAHIASLVANTLEPATVFDPASGKMIAHPIRASDNAPIGPTVESLVVQAINRRIAAATGSQVSQGEPLTVLRYAPGQQYRPHLDTLPGTPANQRIRTAILYLSQGYRGGETQFPLLGITVAAQGGDLLVFDNVMADGSPEPRSRHAGLPVQAGAKWIATRWIRQAPIDPWTMGATG
ncbi:2OG-Fe(II) oxygenase [Sphingomonas sp. KR3-1]|uniref:2OG-Fe(II) oxygenase n=1 Tax=Sphingomonas sp. KR3-1 TaxID=3156611 RepID=UPI0032B36B91